MNRQRRGEVDEEVLWFVFVVLLIAIVVVGGGRIHYEEEESEVQALKRQMLKCETCRKVLEQQAIDEALGDLKKEE